MVSPYCGSEAQTLSDDDTRIESPAPKSEDAQKLIDQGYTVIRGVLDSDQCNALREHVLLTTAEADRQKRFDLFGNIQEQDNRHDLKLDLCEPVVKALNSYMYRCGRVLNEVTGGGNRVVELAAITSENGAKAQGVHADTVHGVTRFLQGDVEMPGLGPVCADDSDSEADENCQRDEDLGHIVKAVAHGTALIYTSLIALQDIDDDMGPTHVWPGTHTAAHHATLWDSKVTGKISIAAADALFETNHQRMTLEQGDLVLYDSRLMHCGGANNKEGSKRSVLCISVQGPGIRPDGTTWTMLRSLPRLCFDLFPLKDSYVTAVAATELDPASALPPPSAAEEPAVEVPEAQAGPDESEGEVREVPDLDDWDAAVQCVKCKKWRACTVDEASKLMSEEGGFRCRNAGYSCSQGQGPTTAEIDTLFNC